MLVSTLYILFFLSCILLIVAILLQPGKADAGALFTSSISSTAFGARGTQSVLAKATIAVSVIFMLLALLLSMNAIIGNNSLMQGSENSVVPASTATTAVEVPVANQDANAAAPTATATAETEANTNTNR